MSYSVYYAYDASKRMTRQYTDSAAPTVESHYFSYNQRNMATQIQHVKSAGPDTNRYFMYNGVGERVIVVDGAGPQYWTYDGRKILTEKDTSSTVRRYRHNESVLDFAGSALEVVFAGLTFSPSFDHAGNVTATRTTVEGTPVTNRQYYSAYGQELAGNVIDRLHAFSADLLATAIDSEQISLFGGDLYFAEQGVLSHGKERRLFLLLVLKWLLASGGILLTDDKEDEKEAAKKKKKAERDDLWKQDAQLQRERADFSKDPGRLDDIPKELDAKWKKDNPGPDYDKQKAITWSDHYYVPKDYDEKTGKPIKFDKIRCGEEWRLTSIAQEWVEDCKKCNKPGKGSYTTVCSRAQDGLIRMMGRAADACESDGCVPKFYQRLYWACTSDVHVKFPQLGLDADGKPAKDEYGALTYQGKKWDNLLGCVAETIMKCIKPV